ncbi:MAG: hypothetical protein ACRERD_01325 [Candidatus Binatia bacterium]
MKCTLILKAMIAGVVLTVALMWSERAVAGEEFGILAGVPAQAITHGEMAAVEGKLNNSSTFLGLSGLLEGIPTVSSSSRSATLLPGQDPTPFDFSPSRALNSLGVSKSLSSLTALPALKNVSLPPLTGK